MFKTFGVEKCQCYGKLRQCLAKYVIMNLREKKWKLTSVLDTERIKGPLSKCLRYALNFIERNTKTGWKKTQNGGREEVRSYPKEAMVNAIAHCDYSINGTQIDVDIYSDRIDIISPWFMAFTKRL